MLVGLLFKPAGKGLSSYPEGARNTSPGGTLKVGFQYFFFALLTIPGGSI
jgi:hypothetical protein